VLINVPVLKDHDGAGVTIALKNMYGVIHNPTSITQRLRSICRGREHAGGDSHQDAADYLRRHHGDVRGGPAFKPEHSWKMNALLAAQDPVALDFTGWQIIERKRAEKGLKTLEAEKRAPHYIAAAADREHRLGNADPSKISVSKCSRSVVVAPLGGSL